MFIHTERCITELTPDGSARLKSISFHATRTLRPDRGVLAGLLHTDPRMASRQGTPRVGGSWYRLYLPAILPPDCRKMPPYPFPRSS